jgi:dienelactone hydrolase
LTAFLHCTALAAIGVTPVQAADPPGQAQAAVAAAEKFAADFFSRQFDKAVGPFDATMTKAMPADKLRDLLDGLEKQLGTYRERGRSRLERVQQYQVVFVPCTFEKAALEMKVVLDTERRVSGLFFVPPKPAVEWTAPRYADPQNFAEEKIDVVTKPPAGTVGPGREWRLPGFLTIPAGAGPFPGVVLVHGSGPNDADETIGPNKPFKDLAWGLASRGVAVLRYVKRTRQFGKELAESAPEFTVREETEEDAESAIRLLRQTPRVDAGRVYLLGHSLGGLLAPRIAGRTPDLAGIVICAGNTRSFGELVVDQLRYIFADDGTVSPEEQKQLDEAVKARAIAESPDLKPGDKVTILGATIPGAYFLDLRSYNPVAAAAKLSQRILVLQGESDYQVTMADFAGWQQGLAARPDARLKSFPKLNHFFIRVEGKSTPEKALAPGHVDEAVVTEIARWIAEGKPQ